MNSLRPTARIPLETRMLCVSLFRLCYSLRGWRPRDGLIPIQGVLPALSTVKRVVKPQQNGCKAINNNNKVK
jgi:hypothetical protein